MPRRLTLIVLAFVNAFAGCAEEQPWPMGHWEGESTLVHLDTMAVTTSPLRATMVYPSLDPERRYSFTVVLGDRTISGVGAPVASCPIQTAIDGGAFASEAEVKNTGGSTARLAIEWRVRHPDAGFPKFDPSAPVIYTERCALRRLIDVDVFGP